METIEDFDEAGAAVGALQDALEAVPAGILREGARDYSKAYMGMLGCFADAWDGADGCRARWDSLSTDERMRVVVRTAKDHFEADLDLAADHFRQRMAATAAEMAEIW
uniref:Uncharacterized protein n=1 Tax=Muribaculaceae bacterium Z82 TaxID=2304548 RepID=A0A7C9NV99_9BACT